MLLVSREKRLTMRPIGLSSKNLFGDQDRFDLFVGLF